MLQKENFLPASVGERNALLQSTAPSPVALGFSRPKHITNKHVRICQIPLQVCHRSFWKFSLFSPTGIFRKNHWSTKPVSVFHSESTAAGCWWRDSTWGIATGFYMNNRMRKHLYFCSMEWPWPSRNAPSNRTFGAVPHQTSTGEDQKKYCVMAENGQVYSPIKRGGSSSEIIKQFNISNAKLLALVLVVFLVAYHAVLKSVNGSLYFWFLTNQHFLIDICFLIR